MYGEDEDWSGPYTDDSESDYNDSAKKWAGVRLGG
jgi:hypothetical protein